jgi:hypothetical protein
LRVFLGFFVAIKDKDKGDGRRIGAFSREEEEESLRGVRLDMRGIGMCG